MQTAPPRFAFGPRNYRLMWAGLAVLAVGFITMMLDSAQYGEGALGITIGPILLVIGFGIEFAAIMVRSEPALVPAGPAPVATAAPVVAPVVPVAPAAPVARPVVPPAPAKPTYKRPS